MALDIILVGAVIERLVPNAACAAPDALVYPLWLVQQGVDR